MNRLELTKPLRDAIDAVDVAERTYAPGRDSASVIELPKLALADAVLEAVRRQERLSRLPRRADRGVIYVRLQARRGRA